MIRCGAWSLLALAAMLVTPAAARAAEPATPLVRIAFPQEDGSLTPYTFELGYGLMTLVYDTLTTRAGTTAPRPLLAQSVRRRGSTVTVRLRAGARWHDGVPLTAADVVFTYQRFAARPQPRFTPQLRDIESVTALDTRTVVFRLRRPSLGFREFPLADVPILPRHLWAGLSERRDAPPGLAVGSGPYRLVEHRRGRLYRFVANRRWFRAPRVQEIRVPIIETTSGALDALSRRRVDALPLTPDPASVERLRSAGVAFLGGPSYTGTALAFNTRRPPFSDPAVRAAVSRALDLDRIVAGLGRSGPGPVALPADRGYIHPRSPWAGRGLHRFRPDAARVLLAEAALPPVTILVSDADVLRREAGRQVVLALGRLGVDARLTVASRESYERALGGGGTAATFQAAITTIAPLPSRDPSFLAALFGSDAGALNTTGYASRRFDRAALRIDESASPASRRRATAAALRILDEESPVVPLLFPEAAFPFRPATYDDWQAPRGGDLLDKASFVGRAAGSRASGPATAADRVDPVDDLGEPGDGNLPAVLLAVAAALVAVAVLTVWRVVRSR